MDDTIRRFHAAEHGFSGVLYPGSRSPDRAVVYVGGGGSTPEEAIRAASFIRRAGFRVLVLGYYGWDGTPQKMENIPVEYAASAIEYLKKDCGVEKIIMAGASEGAVYSLLCASVLPGIRAVCAVTPMDYIMVSPLARGTVSAVYTMNGIAFSFADFSLKEHSAFSLLGGALRDRRYGLRRMIRYASDQVRPPEDAFIRVEDMGAELLIIVPDYDDIWASEEAAKRMEVRLRENSYAYPFEIVTLRHAGHMMGGDYDLSGNGMRLFRWMLRSEHAYPAECEKARKECLERMLLFFEECLPEEEARLGVR